MQVRVLLPDVDLVSHWKLFLWRDVHGFGV